MTPQKSIYSIGHSTHPLPYFYELLSTHNIDCVVDVRSIAASSYNPQYNKEGFQKFLKNKKIQYLHFKEAFGSIQKNPKVWDEDNQVNFERFRQTPPFQKGIQRLVLGMQKGYHIALMCSNADPLQCHRFSMIAVHLHELGYEVLHILKDKSIQSHEVLEDAFLKKYAKKISKPSLFAPNISRAEQLKQAYRLHNKSVGWIAEKE